MTPITSSVDERETPSGAVLPDVRVEPDARDVDVLATRSVVPLRRPSRWVATAIVLLVVAQIVYSLATNEFYDWAVFAEWFAKDVILEGLAVTLKITAAAAVLGLVLGVLLALGRLSTSPLLRSVSWAYVWFFRSVPLIVILLFLFNLTAFYPTLGFGIPFGPTFFEFDAQQGLPYEVIGIIGLGIAEAAYASEVVRSGILSVDQGQLEAANAVGLSKRRRFTRVVLPQALRTIVPSYVNLIIGLVKASSLVYYVSLLDLFGTVQKIGSTFPGKIVPLLLVATAWYVIITSVLSVIQYYVERHYSKGAVRVLPPTPLQRLRAAVRRPLVRRAELAEVTS